ncbi:hypothetical protein NMG60_11034124 [Bertholletia excelsa]
MDGKKQVGSSSSSSFTAELFGSIESIQPAASTGIFASIFPPPSTVLGRNLSCSALMGCMQKQSSEAGSNLWNAKQGTTAKKNEYGGNSMTKERKSIFEGSVEPCPLSSSLYYGGQEDMYVNSSGTQTPSANSIFKKDGTEDDSSGYNSQGASRGNWWQGIHQTVGGFVQLALCGSAKYMQYLGKAFVGHNL